jgi:hypothetical protein
MLKIRTLIPHLLLRESSVRELLVSLFDKTQMNRGAEAYVEELQNAGCA